MLKLLRRWLTVWLEARLIEAVCCLEMPNGFHTLFYLRQTMLLLKIGVSARNKSVEIRQYKYRKYFRAQENIHSSESFQ